MEKYLKSLGIDSSTLKPAQKGWMSDIYTATSTSGDVIVHKINPVPEQRRQLVHKKIEYVAGLLKHLDIVPMVLHAKEFQGYYIIVQEKMPGTLLGQRKIENNTIRDIYTKDSKILSETEQYLRRIHSVKMTGFGFLKGSKTEFNNWYDFCCQSLKWLDMISESAALRGRLQRLLEDNKSLLEKQQSFLVHGDMVNPGNILIRNNHVSAILDFEWALAGDPAWEFAYTDQFPRYSYFSDFNLEEIAEFNIRKNIYAILWRLWGCIVHREGLVKEILFTEFRDLLPP